MLVMPTRFPGPTNACTKALQGVGVLVFVQVLILSVQVWRSWAIFGAVSERVALAVGSVVRRRRRV